MKRTSKTVPASPADVTDRESAARAASHGLPKRSRRQLLAGGTGALAALLGAEAIARPAPANAADGGPVLLGDVNSAAGSTTINCIGGSLGTVGLSVSSDAGYGILVAGAASSSGLRALGGASGLGARGVEGVGAGSGTGVAGFGGNSGGTGVEGAGGGSGTGVVGTGGNGGGTGVEGTGTE